MKFKIISLLLIVFCCLTFSCKSKKEVQVVHIIAPCASCDIQRTNYTISIDIEHVSTDILSDSLAIAQGKIVRTTCFPGGMENMILFLKSNVRYSAVAAENRIRGMVVVSFIISAQGQVKDIKLLEQVDLSIDKEAVRVVKSMPEWIPAEIDGTRVEAMVIVGFDFEVKDIVPKQLQ